MAFEEPSVSQSRYNMATAWVVTKGRVIVTGGKAKKKERRALAWFGLLVCTYLKAGIGNRDNL